MADRVEVYYEGWGERWLWGTLATTTALTRRPLIFFEYSQQALEKGFELSAFSLPLKGDRLRQNFPAHQLGLPGPVYDSLPDGWGMLLMDRLFRQRGLSAARIGPLERLTYIGSNAMGAMSFVPVQTDLADSKHDIPLTQLAEEVREVKEEHSCIGCYKWAVRHKGRDPKPCCIVTLSPDDSRQPPLRVLNPG